MIKILLCVSLYIVVASVSANEWDFSKNHKEKCSSGSMKKMSYCMEDAYSTVSGRMDKLYKELLSKLSHPSELKNSQEAWNVFVNKSCVFILSGITEDGSLYSFAENSCLIDHYEKRILDLKKYLKWDGCNGCPVYKLQ